MHKVCVLYECWYFLRKIGICLQGNAAKALIIMIIKKMTFSQPNQYPKVGKLWRGNIDTQEWGKILKKDPKLGRLTSPSKFLGAARPGCQPGH